jgi:selenocysteine synthase-like protein
MADQNGTLLCELPSVDRLLNHARCEALLTRYNRDYVTQKCRDALHIGLIAGEYSATSKANYKARPPWSKAWAG